MNSTNELGTVLWTYSNHETARRRRRTDGPSARSSLLAGTLFGFLGFCGSLVATGTQPSDSLEVVVWGVGVGILASVLAWGFSRLVHPRDAVPFSLRVGEQGFDWVMHRRRGDAARRVRFDELTGGSYIAIREMDHDAWVRTDHRLALDAEGGACFEQWASAHDVDGALGSDDVRCLERLAGVLIERGVPLRDAHGNAMGA